MITIREVGDMRRLDAGSLTDALREVVEKDCEYLLSGEGEGSLVRVCVVEHQKDDAIAILQGSEGGWLEWAEIVRLSDGTRAYRACVMEDNDCFAFCWLMSGVDPILDAWLNDQVER